MPLRVGVDYLPAAAHVPGVGRYLRELVRALAAAERDHDGPGGEARIELLLLELGRAPRAVGEDALGIAGAAAVARRRRLRLPRRLLGPLARATGLCADSLLGGADLVHGALVPPLPVARARRTLALAELARAASPAAHELRRALAGVDELFVFSDHGAREAVRRLDWPAERVRVTPPGCDHWRRQLSTLPARADPPLVLALGALAVRRRPLELLRAVEHLRAGGIEARLVWAGRAGDAARAFEAARAASPARAAVSCVRDPREESLPGLVARAAVLVHLCDEQLTPVTPLEAFSFGTPVVASRLPAFEEALAGEAALVADEELAGGPQALADALARAIAGSAEEAGARRRLAVAAPFSWRACARATAAAWRAVAAR